MADTMKTTNLTVRVDQDFKDTLIMIAKQRDIPMSQIVRDALKEWLNNHEQ